MTQTNELKHIKNKLLGRFLSYQINDITIDSWINIGYELYQNDENKIYNFIHENIEAINAKPLVKRVGGKRQLLTQLQKLFPKANEFNNYFEPFLGGGAVFFDIQRKKSYISDINEELINVYKVVKNNPNKLVQELKTYIYDKDFYNKIRARDRVNGRQNIYTDIQKAARFIYLNRTCFNGLHRVNSKGQFNVPMGAYKNPDFIQEINIKNCSDLLNKTNADIQVAGFEKVLEHAKKGDFIYLDPPYDTLTDTANFTSYNSDGFGRDMQIKLRDVFMELHKRGCKVMLSNHNTNFIRDIYNGYRFEIVYAKRNINSNAALRGNVEEIVVLNY